MVEDALKTCRNLHRLVIVVNVAALVFALTIGKPDADRLVVEQIDGYESVDFSQYPDWADQAAEPAYVKAVKPQRDRLAQRLEDSDDLTLNTHHIAEAFDKPVHIGRVLVEDSILTEGEAAKIEAVERMLSSTYDVGREIQVVVPELSDELVDAIIRFLELEGGAGTRVDNVSIQMPDVFSVSLGSFIEAESLYAQLYFEVVLAEGGAPVFTRDIKAEVLPVGDASLLDWLGENAEDNPAFELAKDHAVLFPALRPFEKGFAQKTVGEVRNQAVANIRAASPESKSITLLGTDVPGQLATIAAPIVSTALLIYLMLNLPHINRLTHQHADEIAEFAWLPLHGGRLWLIETGMTLLALPVAASFVMNQRLAVFGTPRVTMIVVSIALALVSVAAALKCISALARLRKAIGRTV